MPRFEPFRGIRYDVHHLDPARVTAPPYDVISPDDREALLAEAPQNVVRIDLPAADRRTPMSDPYATAAALFRQWRHEGVLVDDPEPSFTVYRMEAPDEDGVVRHTTGVIGALELSRPGEGDILPHEFTTPKAKSDRLDLLRSTTANLSPVWGLSPAAGSPSCSSATTGPSPTSTPTGSCTPCGASPTPTGSRPSPPPSAPSRSSSPTATTATRPRSPTATSDGPPLPTAPRAGPRP